MPKTRRIFDVRSLFHVVLLLCLPAGGLADDHLEPHDHIVEAARQHVLDRAGRFPGQLSVKVTRPDRRLRLARCDQPLDTYESPNGLKPGRSVVGVRCDGSKPWKLFVSVSIATLQPVVVASQPLARGQLIGRSDLEIAQRDTARMHKAYYGDPDRVIGLRAKRNVRVGRAITPGMLARDQLVRRGSQVEIIARSGNLQVRMKGKALSNGALGERIRVKNLSSAREITGLVIEPGLVLVQQ